jgi:PAS domain S-box-containing protein
MPGDYPGRKQMGQRIWLRLLCCIVGLAGLGASQAPTNQTGLLASAHLLLALVCAIALAFAIEAAQETAGLDTIDGNYRALFDTCPQPMWVYDLQTLKLLAVNDAAVRRYGYSREEFLEKRLEDIVEDISGGVLEKGLPLETHQRHRKKDGSLFPVNVAQREFRFSQRRAALVIATDNAEGKWPEKRAAAFSRLARRLTAARTPMEAAHIFMDTAYELFNWDACTFDICPTEKTEVRTVLYIDTIDGRRVDVSSQYPGTKPGPQMRLALEKGAQLILRDDTPDLSPESVPFGDTQRASASLMFAPIRRNGNVIGVLSLQSYRSKAYTEDDLNTLQDLGDLCGATLERIRVEDEILRLNAELEQRVKERTAQLEAINHELEAFSYSVSHDLRAPLRSIRGFSEVLLERYCEKLDARGQEFLRRSCESSRQMDNLIEDLLKLSRVGRAQMQLQSVDLSAVAASIAADLKKADPDRLAEFVIAPGLHATGDERLLRIALNNLLSNAWKFTSKQPRARIEFGFAQDETPAFFVRDNGAGFDMAYAGKLFGVFQRLHTAGEFPGTGIGLATVQRIINRHGGRAWAAGATNLGATFYFSLAATPDPRT